MEHGADEHAAVENAGDGAVVRCMVGHARPLDGMRDAHMTSERSAHRVRRIGRFSMAFTYVRVPV